MNIKIRNHKQPKTGNRQPQIRNSVFFLSIFSMLFFNCQSAEELAYEQMVINGKGLYENHCANCHQRNGTGLANLYPPIAQSEFLNDKKNIICIIKNGISGEITVKGKTYNQNMPANAQLYDLDIAAVVTYIYASWGTTPKTTTTADEVKKVLENCNSSGL